MMIKHQTIILILICLMFVVDGASSVLMNLGYHQYRVSIYVRAVAEAYFLLLLWRTRQGARVWSVVGFFLWVFLLGTAGALISLYSVDEYHFLSNFRTINKMLFFFICHWVLEQYFQSPRERERIFSLYEILVLTQAAVIILSFAFDFDLLGAYTRYRDGETVVRRFGYQGLIPAQNEISPFFLLGFFYFLWKVDRLRRGWWQLLLVTAGGVLTGAKVTLVLPVILVFYWLQHVIKRLLQARTRFRRTHLLIGGILLLAAVLIVWRLDYFSSRIAPTISYYRYKISDESRGILDAVSSPRRRDRVGTVFGEYVSRFNLVNYLFGGYDLDWAATETDTVDIFIRLGLIGGSTFYYLYLRALMASSKAPPIRLLFVLVWLGVSMVAGHIAFTAINAMYLAILLLFFSSTGVDQHIRVQPRHDVQLV